jgi:putative heme-binding domain-containing protein
VFCFLATAYCLLSTFCCWDEPPVVAPTEPRTPAEEKKLFKLPPGFEAQLVASEPDIAKPINLAFDARGRLWVTSSVEYPFPAQDRQGRDAIHILEDFAPDGRARKISTFANDLNIPLGILPRKDGAIAYSINSVDRFYGATDYLYEKREKLYQGFGYRDTHGMVNSFTLGFDGWLYACHGYSNDSATKGSDGQELRMNSGNIFRMKLDGSHAEAFTRGQVNPFGLCLDPWGNIYSADCHTRPMTQLLHGAYYDSFGKPHDGLGYAPYMIDHMHESTGLAGLVFYAADAFPKEWQGTIFVGNVVTSRINHDKIIYKGSTPEAVLQPDFLISQDPWFRPVFMVLGPDGALYVADFYNRIIGHYEVPLSHPGRDRKRGRIWRIVYHGEDAKAKPPPHSSDFVKASPQELIADLNHPNLTVRMLATHELAERNDPEVVKELQKLAANNSPAPATQRAHAFWVLERLNALTEENLNNALLEASRKSDSLVQVHLLRIAAERNTRSAELSQNLLEALQDKHPLVQRCAAEALGQETAGSLSHLQALLQLRGQVPSYDNHMLHVVRMALRNQLARLSESEFSQLPASAVKHLGDICLGIAAERGGQVALLFLQQNPSWSELLPKLVQHAARHCPHQLDVLKRTLAQYQNDLAKKASLMQGIVQGLREGKSSLPDDLRHETSELAQRLCNSTLPALVQLGLDLCANARLVEEFDTLHGVTLNNNLPEPQRTSAAGVLAALDPRRAEPVLLALLTNSDLPIETREKTAILLAGFNRSSARTGLLQALTSVPSRLANVICYSLANTPGGANELLRAVEEQKASPSVLLTTSVQLRLLNHKRADLNERYAKLTHDLPPADARLADLVRQRASSFNPKQAQAQLGAKLFTQHCASCHQIANQGAKVGPQLDGVGIRGVERLLEDILDPNRNVDQAFRASILVLKDGRTLTGLVLREEGNLVVLADNQGKEQKIEKNDIDERRVSNLSPMPANFDTQLSESDLQHLIAYLLTQRAK